MLAIVLGVALLADIRTFDMASLWPSLAVLGACLSWAIDNNVTRKPVWLHLTERHDHLHTRYPDSHHRTISVYDNNRRRGRSEIVKIDPATREITNELFTGGTRVYSGCMGRHQYLPNGNVLIAVPDEGRAIEVTAHGRMLMEFNNPAQGAADYNEIVSHALWIPADYFAAVPDCRNRSDSR